ncbi:MAG: sugar ABC transporter substrate-binding protein [Christensenella sp.]
MKKLISMVVVVLMVVVLLAGCATPAAEKGDAAASAAAESGKDGKEQITVGFANYSDADEFCQAIKQDMEQACKDAGYKLEYADNKADSVELVKNLDILIGKGVDYLVEFNFDAANEPIIKQKADAAGIPVISVDAEQDGGVFYGVNNKEASIPGGEALAKGAQEKWGKEPVDLFLMLYDETEGEIIKDRAYAFLNGARNVMDIPDDKVKEVSLHPVDTKTAQEVIAATLTANPDAKRILIGCENDQAAAGAVAAVEAANREDQALVAGSGCDSLGLSLILQEKPSFLGTVSYAPWNYGKDMIKLIQKMEAGEKVEDHNYVVTEFVDRTNYEQRAPETLIGDAKKSLGI